MSECNPYPLDYEEVSTFLTSYEVDAVIGTACDDGDCPLARFLNAFYPGSQFLVNMTEYRRVMDDISMGVEGDAVFPLPEWAQDFVFLIDQWAGFDDNEPVIALDALCLFQAACRSRGLLVDSSNEREG